MAALMLSPHHGKGSLERLEKKDQLKGRDGFSL
jgi:hypothetical protein